MKLPALQFYVGDWRKDLGVQSLPFDHRGVWFEMLCLMHESEERGKLVLKGRAIPDDHIARILGLDNQTFKNTLTCLLESGVAVRDEATGAIMSKRMVKDENIRKVRKECGKQGGNPNLVNQNLTNMVKVAPNQKTESEDEDETEESTLKLKLEAPEIGEESMVEEIYQLYPRKVNPGEARSSIRRAMKKHSTILLREKTQLFASIVDELIPNKADRKYVPHPSTWFNQEGFLSDPIEWRITLQRTAPQVKPPTSFDIKAAIASKEARMSDLKRRHHSDTQSLVGGQYIAPGWRDEAAKAEYIKLREELKPLKLKLEQQAAL